MWLSGAGLSVEAACPDFTPQRKAYFGDTHVHTSYSQDANWRMGSTQTTPDDAYRFARGETISLPPYDADGKSLRSLTIGRPLDFTVVTDHAENMDIVRLCDDPAYSERDSLACRKNQILSLALNWLGGWVPGIEIPCAEDSPQCRAASNAVWQDTIAAAENHQRDCDFSTFIGYEWSGSLGGANMHRNVVYRSGQVTELPISALDAPEVEQLWTALDEQCRDAAIDCEAITIPHNSNLSQGRMFSATMSNGEPLAAEVAEQRSRYERLAEIVQHKGASECYAGGDFGSDELCGFEALPYSSFAGKYLSILREEPANDSRYLREALREGLRLKSIAGVNPFTPGFVGSTDTHISAPGAVEESNYQGNHGAQSIIGRGDQPQLPDRVEQNAGGLAVLYAEQNTREALFAAMQRREAYATSGPRIQLRFFGGWDYPDDLCAQPDRVQQGYELGVPMGGDLAVSGDSHSPSFLIAAARDAGTSEFSGTALQRVQVIKAWVDSTGVSREQVYDVAGDAGNGASVDLDSCQPSGPGFNSLCTVWRDPDFDPQLDSFYYARVVENPSCRWQQHICAAHAVSCANPDEVPEGLQGCCDDSVPKTIQERAWSSPIWYSTVINRRY